MEWEQGSDKIKRSSLVKGDTCVHQGALLMCIGGGEFVVLCGSGDWKPGRKVKGADWEPVTQVNAWKVVPK